MAQRRDAPSTIDRAAVLARARGWACYLGIVRVQSAEDGADHRRAVATMEAHELRALMAEYPDAPRAVVKHLTAALVELGVA